MEIVYIVIYIYNIYSLIIYIVNNTLIIVIY